MVNPRKILIVSGARSELGLLEPIHHAIAARPDLAPLLAITGVHLLDEYGRTADSIEGMPVFTEFPFYESGHPCEAQLATAMARGVEGANRALEESGADLLLVLGDRAEATAAALAAHARGTAIAHVHGGEKTDSGHVDEGFRHAVTRWAHLHFAATEDAARRLLAMGEEEWRIHRVGAPGLDDVPAIRAAGTDPASEILARLGGGTAGDFGLFVFHPDRLHRETSGDTAAMILDELLEVVGHVVALYPNSDPGSEAVLRVLHEYRERYASRITLCPSLVRADYLALLNAAVVMAGNSSSGIIEAPSLGLPVVNIGERNRDREHGDNVLFVDADRSLVAAALRRARDDAAWRQRCEAGDNPYGEGVAGQRIAEVIANVAFDERFYRKLVTV